jgi:hypothetical protein
MGICTGSNSPVLEGGYTGLYQTWMHRLYRPTACVNALGSDTLGGERVEEGAWDVR